jgi:predicted house-cleaning NTP pyrophosphatase (Maf/HAM1 superfamily)
MLKSFSGHTFEIIAGLAVFNGATQNLLSTSEVCKVRFRELTDFEINDYVSKYPVMKFAGAFDADGLLRFADYIEGNYNFKAGLPVNKLILFLRENGITV